MASSSNLVSTIGAGILLGLLKIAVKEVFLQQNTISRVLFIKLPLTNDQLVDIQGLSQKIVYIKVI